MATTRVACMLLGRGGRSPAAAAAAAAAASARRRLAVPALVRPLATAAVPPFHYQELFDLGKDTETPYRKLTSDHVSTFKVRIRPSRVVV